MILLCFPYVHAAEAQLQGVLVAYLQEFMVWWKVPFD